MFEVNLLDDGVRIVGYLDSEKCCSKCDHYQYWFVEARKLLRPFENVKQKPGAKTCPQRTKRNGKKE